ncbi:hypothetical protein FJZ31_35540 [Candidatus Poribacteria bacterium]|nr:hypothetical protein [Candidatus Poribacteria bacterium]
MKNQRKFDKSKPYALVTEKGSVQFFVNEIALENAGLSIHGAGWTYTSQDAAIIEKDSGIENGATRRFTGNLSVPAAKGQQMEFTESVTDGGEQGLELHYRIHFPEAVPLNSYQVSVTIKPERLQGRKLMLIGEETEEITIPAEYGSTQLAYQPVREVQVAPGNPEGFTLTVDEMSPLLVQDNRAYGSSEIELRFPLHQRGAGEEVPSGETVERQFRLRYNQPLFVILDKDAMEDQTDTTDWVPFVLPWDDAPIDISFLNEKPAGKHGFLTVQGDRFVFEDGTPVKFWGTCFSAGANFPTHEQSEKIARRLSKFGVNIVRTHHADANWASPNIFQFDRNKPKDNTLSFDPESLDRFDYLLHCLKREGIYIYLDQLVHRKFKPGDGVDASDQLDNAAKPYTNFDPRLIELQKKFSHDLWTHVNPYTGLTYKDDPAIALMEFANENDLFTQRVTLEPYRPRLEERYRVWAREHGIEVESESVDFTQFTAPILRFLHEVQRAYYQEMQVYLRSIGVKVPMTGSNWSRNLALLSSLQVTDYTDSHSYWDHPKQWVEFDNRPMVSSSSNVFAALSFNRILGKPFFVSEWDQPWPNEWRAEHPLAMAAVAAFQDWNGLATYTYRHNTSVPVDYLSGSFETFNDPARFGLFYHAALIFRRGDVHPAEQTVAIYHPENDIFKSPNPTPWQIQSLLATAEKHRLAMALYESPANVDKFLSSNERMITEDAKEVHSDTGELYRSWEKRIGVIDTPYTKAAYGFIGEVESISLRGLNLHVRTPFATVAVSSLTDKPIAESYRILLTAVGRAENTDFRYNILHTKKLDSGRGPILIEPIEANIKLETGASNLKVWAIGADGQRIKSIPVKAVDGRLVFDIGKDGRTIYYLMEKE